MLKTFLKLLACLAVVVAAASMDGFAPSLASHSLKVSIYVLAGAYALYTVYMRMALYEAMLDSLPFPISVTDAHMRWIFVNRPVEQALNKKRHRLVGRHCSGWGSGICNTEDCGVRCLRLGKRQTFFDQWGRSFRVDSSFLTDRWGRRVGHIELVQDMTPHIAMRRQQSDTVERLDRMAGAFAFDSHRIGEESHTLSAALAQQDGTLEDLSQVVGALAEETQGNTAKAEKAMEIATSIKGSADRGTGKMAELMRAAKSIQKANKNIGKAIRQIDTIASQTNMLALNAAIEASKAGAHGKGFAVVAEEVSKLAAKCAKAAENTSDLVADSIEMTDRGAAIASEADESFAGIVRDIGESEAIAREIVDASGAQCRDIGAVSNGILAIKEAMKANAAAAEGLGNFGRDISDQVDQLADIISGLQKSLKK